MTAMPQETRSLHASWLPAVLLVAPLALFGEALISSTHHRPLGAATFASVALLCWAVAEVFCRRALNPNLSGRRAFARRVVWMVSGASALFVIIRALL